MDSRSFYGKRELRTRLPPEDKSDDSCLSDSEDDDVVPYHHTQARVSSSSSEDEDEDAVDEPSASRKRAVRWKKTGCQEQREVPPWESALPEADTVRAPIEYFKDFFDDNFMDHIVEQSNVFATQKNPNKGLALSRDELDQFLGTVTFMSICRLPRSRLYWAAESRVPTVADTMSRDRWEAIKANLHFNNNDDMPPPNDPHKDRLFKVRPVIDFLLPKFQGIPKTQALCVDEQMVPFKGRSSLKQYIPSKPHKWGYKVFLLCDPQGMVHSFEIYTGRIDAVPGEPDIGASGNIVLKLSQNIQPGLNHLLFCDNWFTSLKLFSSLSKKDVHCLGTVRANRLQGCPLPSDASLKKKGRGSFEEFETVVDATKLIALKWYDNRAVTTLSTFAGAEPVTSVGRWERSKKMTVQVECPSAVSIYNKFMGGVDQLDALIAYYRIHVRSKKFYLKIFFHFVDMVVVVAWLLYRRDCDAVGVPTKQQMDLLKFKFYIATCLLKENKDTATKKRGRPSSSVESQLECKKKRGPMKPVPVASVRTDSTGHWPTVETTRQRCKRPGCKGQTVFKCTKCDVHLCLNKNANCFVDFHQP